MNPAELLLHSRALSLITKSAMKLLLMLLALLSHTSFASFTPLSGTFSNAAKGLGSVSFNLIVTVNEQGQQFSLQCLSAGNAGFWHYQTFANAKVSISLTAIDQRYCPASEIEVNLDYEEAYLNYNGKRVSLNRGPIYVPIKD